MKKSDLIFLLTSVFVSATGIFYCAIGWFGIKLPRYYPTEHVWRIGKTPGIPSQGWYTKQAVAYLAAIIVTFVFWIVLKKIRNNSSGQLKPATVRYISMITVLMVLISLGYVMYHEYTKWIF